MTPIWFIHGLADVLADGDYTLIDMLLPPGDQPPLHVHDADEGFLVLEGELCLWAGEEKHVLTPGRFVNAPAGVPHTYRVTSEGRARVIVSSNTGAFARVRAGLRRAGAAARAASSRPRRTSSASAAWPPSTASSCSARPACCRRTSASAR